MSNSKFWKGVFWGAVAGGAISLLDSTTRKNVLENCQRATTKISYYVKHPKEVIENVKESSNKIRHTIEEVGSEVSFLTEKIEELKEITPQITDLVKETKDVFIEGEKVERKKPYE